MQFSFTTTIKLSVALILGTGILLPQSGSANVIKANNSTALTNGASWTLGVAPGASDVVIFTNTLFLGTNANTISPAPLGGNLSILGIRVAGPVLGQADGENGIVITNASSANTLTIGTSGIDLSATNAVPINIQSQIALSGSQTWNISDASANITNPVATLPLPATQNHGDRYTAFLANEDEDLYFNALVAGASFNLGGFTLTLTNSGTTVIDQGYTVSNGVINVNQGTLAIQGGKSRQTTINSNVTINVASGATLRLQTTSGAIVSSAAISLADGSLLNLTAAGTQGTGVVSNSIAVSGNATLSQTQNPIVGDTNSDYSITNVVVANITGASGTTLNLLPTQSGTGTNVLQLSGDNSGFNGAFNINATNGIRPVLLGSATAGSANATWTVNTSNILQVAGVAVALGTLNGGGTISNLVPATTATLNVGAGNFSGNIANAGTAVMALNKMSSSTLTLGGTNTYTGSTAISNGTLLVNGSITSPMTIVYSGGTLGGIGTVRSNLLVNAGGTVAPGNSGSIGTLTVSGTITNGGVILMKLNRTNSQTSDLLSSAKTITNITGGTLSVTNIGPALQLGDTFTLFNATSYSGLLGLLNSTSLPSLSAGLAWKTAGLTNNGTISVVALPTISSLTPLNPSVQCPGNLTFIVTATGQSPLSYQWSTNGSPVNGQTATNFSLSNIHFPGPTVSVTVSNAYGKVVTNSVVTVVDTTAPVVTLNGSNPMTVECHGSFSDPGATANDACAGSVAVRVSGSVDANTTGTYYLTYTADDGNGNTNSVVRTVNVTDTTPPVITYYFTNLVLSADTNCSALMPDVTGTNYITASDACSGTGLVITQMPTNNAVLPEGTNVVVIAVADQSGNTSYSTNSIVVLDETPPVITLNGSASVTVECHGSYVELGATATDNCTLAGLSTNGVVDVDSPGIYPVAYVAVDAAGNSATNTRTVTVVDTTPPVITYYFTNLVLSADTNCSALMPDVTGTNYIMASDACSDTNLTITQMPTNNTVLPEGTNVVVIAVADQSGNTSYSTNSIVVLDETPPVITLNGLASVTVECHGSYVELGATATDNCALAGLSTNGVVDVDTPGIYPIAYVAVDAAGNSATNTRTVTVVDTTPPVVTLNGSSPMTNWLGAPFIDPGATAFDLCAGVLPVTTNGVVNTAVPGTYAVQYIATDPANNSATNTRTVYVVAPVPPAISGGTMLLNGGNFQLTFSGPQGQPYKVMTTTDLQQPGSWAVAATGVFGAVPAVFTDTNDPTQPSRFYRVASP